MDRPQDWHPSVDVDADLVEYVVVALPDLTSLERVAAALAELVSSQAIRILDVVTVVKAADGAVEVLEIEDVDTLAGLRQVGGYFGGLLSSNDVSQAAQAVTPGTAALLLLAEDRWAGPLSVAARAAGGRVLAGERVPRSRMGPALADAAGFVAVAPDDEKEVRHAADGEVS
jgi:hypothetical protein